MNSELAGVAHSSATGGVYPESVGVPEPNERGVQRRHASGPCGDGDHGPRHIDLVSGVGAIDAHVVGEVLSAEGDGHHPGRCDSDLTSAPNRLGGLDPGDDFDGTLGQSGCWLQGAQQLVRVMDVPDRLHLAQADTVEIRRHHRLHFVSGQTGIQGIDAHHDPLALLPKGRDPFPRQVPGVGLFVRRHRVFQVHHDNVGLKRPGPLQHVGPVARHEYSAAN